MLKRTHALLLGIVACFSSVLIAEDELAANGMPSNGATPPTMNQQQMPMSPSQSQSGSIQWLTNYQQAVSQAKKDNKYILLFFTGSDWCGWCKKIENEIFADPEFARTAGDRFVFVDLDFPINKPQSADLSQQNAQLKQRFGITGFPTIILLDSNQNFIAETGYRPGGGKQYADYLMQLVQGGATSGS